MKSFGGRIKTLERNVTSGPGGSDFVSALRDARERAAGGEPVPEDPVTPEMLEDPEHGEFFRQMQEARERASNLRPPASVI
ncbi:MAG: hypothetical protein ABSG91_23940 [Syntrophobacteraceae bacterium]|jgi:hypothetical protein